MCGKVRGNTMMGTGTPRSNAVKSLGACSAYTLIGRQQECRNKAQVEDVIGLTRSVLVISQASFGRFMSSIVMVYSNGVFGGTTSGCWYCGHSADGRAPNAAAGDTYTDAVSPGAIAHTAMSMPAHRSGGSEGGEGTREGEMNKGKKTRR